MKDFKKPKALHLASKIAKVIQDHQNGKAPADPAEPDFDDAAETPAKTPSKSCPNCGHSLK